MFAHFRPLLFVFVFMLLGIYFGNVLFYVSSAFFYVVLSCFLLTLPVLIFSWISHKNKFTNYVYSVRFRIICIVLSFIVGVGSFCLIRNTTEFEYNFDKNVDYYAVATVKTNYSYDNNEKIKFLVKGVSVLVNGKEVKLSKNVYISITVEDFGKTSKLYNLTPDDEIVITGKFTKTPVFGAKKLYEYAYKNNFEYAMYLTEDDVVLHNKDPVGLNAVRKHIQDTLYQNMSPKYASLAYSVLIGDRTGLDDEIENNLKITGVAHIVAVSGLHVGFIVLLLLGFCRLCRIKKGWAQLLVVSIMLIFFCILCNLTPSVTRATLMAICLLSAKAFKKQSDRISSVSLAGIIILCLHPLYVFDVSFQLSFAAAFAIILLVPLFSKIYKKWKDRKFLYATCDTINLSLSAQIGTTPYIMKTFGYVSTFSLIVNVFIVPFFGIVYMALFVLTLLSCIMPFLGWALFMPEMCFVVIDNITALVASIPYSTLPVKVLLPIELFVWGLTLFIVSDKCVLNKKLKKPIAISSIGITIVILILCLLL